MPNDTFRPLAAHYERLFPYPGPEALMPLLDLGTGQVLLDVGGGTSRVARTLPDDCRRVVVDQSLAMLRQGQRSGVLLCAAQAERLPFPDASFDRCLFVDSFHHLLNQRLAASEALRVLRPGGRVVIEEPDIRRPLIKLIAVVERLLQMRSRFLGLPDMERLFLEEGGSTIFRERDGAAVRLVIAPR